MISLALFAVVLSADPQVERLPRLLIDPDGVTASGISSGADFVGQFHLAFSSVIKGVGIFAGQPYGCAVTRFPLDELKKSCAGNKSCDVPICHGCPHNATLQYDHCKQHPEWVVPETLQELAINASNEGKIDNITNLHTQPVYIYRGTKDPCYVSGAEARVIEFYNRFVGDGGRNDGGLIAYEGSIPSMHAQPTIHAGSPCGGPYDGPYSYLAHCNYDGAGAVLNHMYNSTLKSPVKTANLEFLKLFNQTEFFGDIDPGLAAEAYVYIPPQCAAKTMTCKLHFWFHGCGGPDRFYNASVHFAGFNEWAESNNIVMVYPAMRSWGYTHQTLDGCWDGYAQTGNNYMYQDGIQMATVRRMLKQIAGF
eukprot:m.6811 g.6811  ORF g.6811 m.6811 type:complete len:365 (+) comp3589_c0_seq1:117-1211(+)